MIAYFDTSAVIPLLIAETGSERARHLWNTAERVVSARLVYPEGRAALAQAHRLGRLTTRHLRVAVEELGDRHSQLDLVEIDHELAWRAGELAERHGLRGYDSVHLAAAHTGRDSDLVVVAGDGALLRAAQSDGLATAGIA